MKEYLISIAKELNICSEEFFLLTDVGFAVFLKLGLFFENLVIGLVHATFGNYFT